jgi:hypothetical protein
MNGTPEQERVMKMLLSGDREMVELAVTLFMQYGPVWRTKILTWNGEDKNFSKLDPWGVQYNINAEMDPTKIWIKGEWAIFFMRGNTLTHRKLSLTKCIYYFDYPSTEKIYL